MIVALTNSITLNITKSGFYKTLSFFHPWTCSLVAFEMIASQTETRSAIIQLSSSKPLGCIRKMIKDEVCDQFVFEWGQVDNSMQSVCDNTAVCL